MINRVVLVGRLTKDPVLRKTQSGASVVQFTVACDRNFKTDGQPTADFINCVTWNKTADVVANYTRKGHLIGVEGRIQTRSYDDQTGKRVFITEVLVDSVQLLNNKSDGQQNQQQTQQQDNVENHDYSGADYGGGVEISADDLPF